MTKDKTMRRKSHLVEDVQYYQNLSRLSGDLPVDQPTRPTLGKQQATKSSKEESKPTK